MHFRLLLTLSTLGLSFSSEWNYQGHGPDYWINEYPNCAGKLQSPINIEESNAIYDPKLGHISFHNYEWLLSWNVSNNGHTIIANQISNETLTPYITGSDFKPDIKYYLKQFHFHWGFNKYQGSEHHINRKKFPLEVHLVHGSDMNETTVVAFLFQIDSTDNEKLKNLMTEVEKEDKMLDSSEMEFSVSSLLPSVGTLEKEGYFRYMGSLTTPPCTEGVKWTIFKTKINISEAQMEKFYKNQIEFNYREVQELNNRALFTNVGHKTENGVVSSFILSIPIYIIILTLNLLTINF